MKRYLPFIIVAVIGLSTLLGAVLLYRAKKPVAPAVAQKREPEKPESVHSLGPDNAKVVLEEFGDFQCPPCGALSEPLNKLVHDFPDLRLVFHNFPLPMHSHSNEAALAAEAAGLQGQFWKMHDVLYREQAVWSKALDVRELFNSYAAMLRCNVDRFKKDVASEAVIEKVKADQEQGKKLGVTNTPTIFINNTLVPPVNLNPEDLRAAIEAALKETKPKAGG